MLRAYHPLHPLSCKLAGDLTRRGHFLLICKAFLKSHTDLLWHELPKSLSNQRLDLLVFQSGRCVRSEMGEYLGQQIRRVPWLIHLDQEQIVGACVLVLLKDWSDP